jgi:hypothetical protein
MAPPGTKVIIHETPTQRGTWFTHGGCGWYLGPAPNHYRRYRLYVTKTAAERIVGTVAFFPEQCPMPRLSSSDTITKSALDLIHVLHNPALAAPFAKLGEERLAALHQLATIFRTATTQPPPRVEANKPLTQSPPRVAAFKPSTDATNTYRAPPHDNTRQPLVHNDYVYVEINKGMYGLPQAGLLANELLARRLAKYGYHQATDIPGLWKHTWQPIQFVLVVDDFGVEYASKQHATHLLDALNNHYEAVSENWKGLLFCGIKLEWDYTKKIVDLSMPGYITQALHKFQHATPKLMAPKPPT